MERGWFVGCTASSNRPCQPGGDRGVKSSESSFTEKYIDQIFCFVLLQHFGMPGAPIHAAFFFKLISHMTLLHL